jgi:hypothetical protein
MAIAILDTSVYIDHWERGLYQETQCQASLYRPPFSSGLSELRRGARGRDAERLVASLLELATVRWEPSAADWWEASMLSEASVATRAGTYTSAETFKTIR